MNIRGVFRILSNTSVRCLAYVLHMPLEILLTLTVSQQNMGRKKIGSIAIHRQNYAGKTCEIVNGQLHEVSFQNFDRAELIQSVGVDHTIAIFV